jgi:hypothetical protein
VTSTRDYLEAEVAERARHLTAEHVRTTCSFARAERLLGREYHGRFLIELLQNAADASQSAATASGRSRVVVRITEGPALLVANQGAQMGAEVVVQSLGHIGASTKAEGEAIGHKGIGFKSVLELTLTPEIYSGLQRPSPALAVGFDPERARTEVREASPRWDEWVAGVQGLDPEDHLAAVPVLRFPHWVEDLPTEVADLKERGFDTVVRLPFDERFAGRLGFDADTWLATVRGALGHVSDEILLLLGCFDEVRLEDRLARSETVIKPEWEQAPVAVGQGVSREVVRVRRNGDLSSRWRLFRRALPDRSHLAGEIAVGIRVGEGPGAETVLPAVEGEASAPFHLFFPTRIPSGLPFLLHAYFEVDAARTGFYRGSAERNRAMLAGLAELVKIAVADVAGGETVDLVSLVNLVAEAGEPEDPSAGRFRSDVLGLLDDVAWVPLEDGGARRRGARPAGVFAARPELVRLTGRAFPAPYVRQRTGLGLPDDLLGDAALRLVMARRPPDAPGLWDTIGLLCRPGETPPWDGPSADRGFLRLLDLFAALDVEDRNAARGLLDALRGDPTSALIPTVVAGDDRALLPIPDPSESAPGRRSRLVMARVRSSEGRALVPPGDLDVAFLPDGLLSNEAELDRARPLGVRPFTVDNVLDRLSGIEREPVDGEALVRFLWQLLARERLSSFSTRRSAERASVFDPHEWFWCRPGRAREDDTTRLRQQRERYLAAVLLPCADGGWRRAGRIAFGADWADWLEERAGGHPTTADRARIAAYRAMQEVSPGPGALLAPPGVVLSLLGEEVFDEESLASGDEVPGEALDGRQRDAERHAFLLRLGVWEVPPIEAFESRSATGRINFPWTGPVAEKQREVAERDGGWRFGLGGWSGGRHHKVHLAEDYRFLWPLEKMAKRSPSSLMTCLRLGAKLYGERSNALFFCPYCSDGGGSHRTPRHSTGADGYPSWLAIQLRDDRWIPCALDGDPLPVPTTPGSAWWQPKPPSGAGLRQSPWRLVPLCSPNEGIDDDLRRLAGINTLDDAQADVVEGLLVELRARFEGGRLPVDPLTSSSARQAFVGLHRLAYERLSELSLGRSEAADVLERTGVLCELGEGLVYRPPGEARHDDGRFSTYVRHFGGSIPFAALPRDKEAVASQLGVEPFRLRLIRQGDDDGRDVTDDVRGLHGDRIAELLSIMVHHSLGTQTLDATSDEFERRARRIRNLRINQVENLLIDASVEGSPERVTLGEGSTQDLFLEAPASSSPMLFHDLSGDGWQDRLRRKIAPYLATILENQAYAHTFALFLLRENDAEREEFLLELGISADEVEAVATRIGVVRKEEQQRHMRWYRSVLDVLAEDDRKPPGSGLDPEDLASRLEDAGLPAEAADRLVELGGGEAVRRETGRDSALRLLVDAGVDLRALDSTLRRAGDPGLSVGVARRRLSRWVDTNGRRLSAVLATALPPDVAKRTVDGLGPPPELRLSIDPALPHLLSPVVDALQNAGLHANARSLANDPAPTLARLAGFGVEELDAKVLLLFDEEEQRRFLRDHAARWRREIRLLAVLARTRPSATRAAIRATDEAVTAALPLNPSSPADLRDALGELLSEHPALARQIGERLAASVNVVALDRDELLSWARQDGVAVDRLALIERALETPRRDQARALKERSQRLAQRGVRPAAPPGLREMTPTTPRTPKPGPKKVVKIKVGGGLDRRKRELGDEGERWALAAVVRDLMELDHATRDTALGEVVALLEHFEGAPVDAALAHAARARARDLDDEERIDELSGLLHTSRHSDAFGFDMIGWIPSSPGREGRAVCLEVKSSGGEGFHLSRNEWSVAEKLRDEGTGDRYAVLVVRRAKGGSVPAAMDLLADPVALVKAGLLRSEVDGYQIAYRTNGQ